MTCFCRRGIHPSGLRNNSEVCYMNSMIQIAASSSIFKKKLKKLKGSNCNTLNNLIDVLRCVNKSQNKRLSFDDVLNRNTKKLEELIRSIGWTKPSQQDSFDLFSTMIKAIHDDLKRISKDIQMPMKIKLVHKFTGMDIPDKIQDHLGLSVGLCGNYTKRPGESLENLIKEHFSPTIIDDDPSKTTQMVFYQQAPDVLLIHIQANKWDHERGEMVKPEYYIKYEEYLNLEVDIQKTLNKKEKHENVKYKLKGFISHIGSISGGHYISYRRHNRQWYLINDEAVNKIGFDGTVVPYIMIYEKK